MQHYSLKIWIEIYSNRNIFLSSQLSFNLPLPLFIPYFSTFQFEAIKINIWIFSLRDLFFFYTGIFDSRITRISNIEIQSLFPYLRSCNASSIFKNRYRSCTWYIFANFSRNSASSLSLSLSLFSLLVSLGEASRTRIETMAEKRYRGTGASWQGRTTTSRMLLYVGNTSFILRSISVSTLERKPPCPLFSLPSSPSLSLSLSRFLLLNSVSTRSFDFSRNIGVSRLVVRRNYVSCWGKKLNVRFNSIERFHSIWRYQKFFSFFHFGKWV